MVAPDRFDAEGVARSLMIVESDNGRDVSMPFAKWEKIGVQLIEREKELGKQLSANRVLRAVWWRYGTYYYGADALQAEGATLVTLGVSERTLDNDAVVIGRIDPDVLASSYVTLGFERLEAIAYADPNKQARIAAKAERENLTADEIRRNIAGKSEEEWARQKALMQFQQSYAKLDKPGRSMARRWLRQFHRAVSVR